MCIPGYEDEPAEKMEKQRFTVLLPGDCQEEVLRLAKLADRRSAPPQSGNVACRLTYVDPASQYPPLVGQAASWLLPIVAFAAFTRVLDLYATLRGKKRNLRQEMASQLGKSRAARTSGLGRGNTGVLFADVAGQEPAIQAFQELISMILGNPRFKVAGAKLPRGVLLEGPPGTGKTLLARAVAGEAGVPFFSANGSEFVEMYVGVAAARVRDLFRRARAAAPSIIFIGARNATRPPRRCLASNPPPLRNAFKQTRLTPSGGRARAAATPGRRSASRGCCSCWWRLTASPVAPPTCCSSAPPTGGRCWTKRCCAPAASTASSAWTCPRWRGGSQC